MLTHRLPSTDVIGQFIARVTTRNKILLDPASGLESGVIQQFHRTHYIQTGLSVKNSLEPNWSEALVLKRVPFSRSGGNAPWRICWLRCPCQRPTPSGRPRLVPAQQEAGWTWSGLLMFPTICPPAIAKLAARTSTGRVSLTVEAPPGTYLSVEAPPT